MVTRREEYGHFAVDHLLEEILCKPQVNSEWQSVPIARPTSRYRRLLNSSSFRRSGFVAGDHTLLCVLRSFVTARPYEARSEVLVVSETLPVAIHIGLEILPDLCILSNLLLACDRLSASRNNGTGSIFVPGWYLQSLSSFCSTLYSTPQLAHVSYRFPLLSDSFPAR